MNFGGNTTWSINTCCVTMDKFATFSVLFSVFPHNIGTSYKEATVKLKLENRAVHVLPE